MPEVDPVPASPPPSSSTSTLQRHEPPHGGVVPASPPPSSSTSTVTKVIALGAVVALLSFVFAKVNVLWTEWHNLQGDMTTIRHGTVIGYQNISPNLSLAEPPDDWVHDEGEQTLLWTGWKPGVGHTWFRVGRGDVEARLLSSPLGRDVIPAIDRPLVEVGGGERWGRIPWDAIVAGYEADGVPSAYPMLLLRKVVVVNDQVQGRPYLVVAIPSVPLEETVHVYDPILHGARLTMGLSGYLYDRKPLLYDRDSESLWVDRDGALAAVAGPKKGATLKKIDRPVPVVWADWRSKYPNGRLVVGSERPAR